MTDVKQTAESKDRGAHTAHQEVKARNDEDRLRWRVRFKGYLLENVYLRTTEAQRCEILALWRDGGIVLDQNEAERRSREAVFLVRTAPGELAGLSEVALLRVRGRRRFYAYTMLLRQRDRVPYLMLAVLNATRDFLRNFAHPRRQPEGMLLVTENRKLMRPGVRKLLARHGYRYWGRTERDDDVWSVEFVQTDQPASTFGRFVIGDVQAQESARCQSPPLAATSFESRTLNITKT
jgi:hypothetical protein